MKTLARYNTVPNPSTVLSSHLYTTICVSAFKPICSNAGIEKSSSKSKEYDYDAAHIPYIDKAET